MMHRPLKIRKHRHCTVFVFKLFDLMFEYKYSNLRHCSAEYGILPRFFLSSIFFVSNPSSSLNGTQPKPAKCSELSANWKCMSEIWGNPHPYKSGPQNHLFSTTSQLNGKFNSLYLRNKTWHTQQGKCIRNYKRSPTSSQNAMNLGLQMA